VKIKLASALAGCALTVLVLAGCSTAEDSSTADSPAATSDPAAAAEIATADSDLGEIIVDGEGMTAYVFDKDVADSGESTCVGECLAAWPPIMSASDEPVIDGVTGTIETISIDGGKQITINGLPIYTFAKDTAPGDTNGQGVNDVWWVISPDGEKISESATGQ